jgi:uncharacterized protein (TIGR03435 family)
MGQLARFHRKSSSLVPLVVTVCWLAGSACQAQVSLPSATASAQERPVVFETASIRPSRDGEPFDQQLLADGFLLRDGSVRRLLCLAYFSVNFTDGSRLRSVPDWVRNDLFDVLAKVSTEDAATWQRETASGWDSPALKNALQALLAERYKLKAHIVNVEEDGFALVVNNSGRATSLVSSRRVQPQPSAKPYPDDGSTFVTLPDFSLQFRNQPLSKLALAITSLSGFLVEDRTGLAGSYDFLVGDKLPVPATEQEREDYRLPTERWDLEPLGLKLVRAKVHTTALVVDHIERPSPN